MLTHSAQNDKFRAFVILSVSEVSTNLKCGLHLTVWIFRYAQNDSEPSEQGKVCSKSEPSQPSQKPSKPKKPAQKCAHKSHESEQASQKAKFAQKASQRAEQGKNANPSLAQSLNPKRDFALRSKKPAEPQRQSQASEQPKVSKTPTPRLLSY